jgi:bifunctional non-homologous end joining protein LigD
VITHPEKVLFPEDGITKGDLAAYYTAIAPVMLPHLKGRPVTMERYPAGIGKKGFWQKDVSKGFPEWLERVEVPKKDGVVHHPIISDTRSLLWVTNQNTITQHVWTSRTPNLNYPDICVFDLDPSKDDVAAVRAAAIGLRDLLEKLTLKSWVKTSGSKGFHIVVRLDGKTPMGQVERFANAVGTLFVTLAPGHLTQEFSKADRRGRIYVDTGRNAYSATFAAAYTVRAKRGAPVSAPCTWEEIERGEASPTTFTLRNMSDRVASVGDLWADMRRGQSLKRPMEKLRILLRMKHMLILFCLLAAPALQAQAPAAASKDEAAVRALVERYVNARDARDEKAIEALFTADVDQYTTGGEWRRGRAGVVTGTAESTKQNPGDRSIPVESVRFISPDVAIVDGPYVIAGSDLRRWTTIVATRQRDGWRIAAIRNMAPSGPTRITR